MTVGEIKQRILGRIKLTDALLIHDDGRLDYFLRGNKTAYMDILDFIEANTQELGS